MSKAKPVVIDEIDAAIENPVPEPPNEYWRKLVPVLMAAQIGHVVTYEEMNRALGSGSDIQVNRSPYYRALIEVEEHGRRTFECIRGEGYKRVHPNEHTRLAENRTRSARHHLGVAERILTAVDADYLTPHELRVAEEHLAFAQDNTAHMDHIAQRTVSRMEALAEIRRQQEMRLKAEAEAATGESLRARLASE